MNPETTRALHQSITATVVTCLLASLVALGAVILMPPGGERDFMAVVAMILPAIGLLVCLTGLGVAILGWLRDRRRHCSARE